jgi:hypothetical protein
MKLGEFVKKLNELREELRDDTEVLITDGVECIGYRGDFHIQTWTEDDGTVAVDIGIGYCREF